MIPFVPGSVGLALRVCPQMDVLQQPSIWPHSTHCLVCQRPQVFIGLQMFVLAEAEFLGSICVHCLDADDRETMLAAGRRLAFAQGVGHLLEQP